MNYTELALRQPYVPPGAVPSPTTEPVPAVAGDAPARRAVQLPRIVDAIPQPVLLVDVNGTIVGTNTAAVEVLQAPTTHLLGRGVLDVLPQFDLARTPGGTAGDDRQNNRQNDGQDDQPIPMAVRCTDGFEFTAEVAIRVVRRADVDHEPASSAVPAATYAAHGPVHEDRGFLMVTITDLTLRLAAERACQRVQRQTELILYAVSEGIVAVDAFGRIMLANPAAARLLGRSAGELYGRELLSLAMHSAADGKSLPPDESTLSDTLRSGRSHHNTGAVLWGRDDTWHPVELSTVPVTDEGRVVGAIVAFTDQSAAYAAAARRDRLAAVLDHELRAPLSQMAQVLTRLAEDPAGVLWPEANRILRQLAEECGRATTLADRLLLRPADDLTHPAADSAPRRPPASRAANSATAQARPVSWSSRRGEDANDCDGSLRGVRDSRDALDSRNSQDTRNTRDSQRSSPWNPPTITVPGTVVDTGPPHRRHRKPAAVPRVACLLEAGTPSPGAPVNGG
ncbi:PAS domain-containing protein [Streptodolium elevatio]